MNTSNKKRGIIKALLISEIFGFLLCFLILAVFSFFLSILPLAGEMAFKVCSKISLAFGAFFSGLIFAKFFNQKGIFLGIIAGLFMFLISFTIGAILFGLNFVEGTFLKLILLLLSGAFGGIIGVNL